MAIIIVIALKSIIMKVLLLSNLNKKSETYSFGFIKNVFSQYQTKITLQVSFIPTFYLLLYKPISG